jgi:hypothetical protein
MENHAHSIESLVERVEEYGKTNIELYKLKTIDKSADIISSLAAKLTVIVFFTLIFLILNIGIALWIGDLLGKTYYGFFTVAAFYTLVGVLLYAFRDQWIKTPVKNSIIINALN